jgi:ribosomal protein S6
MFTLPKKSYKIILLYNCDIELGEFQLFALKFFQFLYRLGGKNITINLIGEGKLAYSIKNQETAQFVEIKLDISPKAINKFIDFINLDQNLIRYYTLKTS